MFNLRSLCALGVVAGALSAASGAITVMDFSPYAGLAYGSGTTQTITQNGVQMACVSGRYEITINPYHELNLKDFTGSDAPRTVQFTMLTAQPFDFLGLSRQDGFGSVTITSDLGGSLVFDLFSPPTLDFSAPQWHGVSWIQVTTAQRFGEFKFNSFTFDTTPTPAPAGLSLLGAAGLLGLRRRRGA